MMFWGMVSYFLDNELHFLDGHLGNLCFGITSECLGE